MERRKEHLHIAFLLQNSALVLDESTAAATQMLRVVGGLQKAGHRVTFLCLRRSRKVLCTDDLAVVQNARLGFSQSRLFTVPEGVIRRLQSELSLPYLGFFDSVRFYDACLRNLGECSLFHERNSLFAFGAALASKRMSKPYVLFVDADPIFELDYIGKPLRGIQRFAAIWAARFTYRTALAIICVSNVAKNALVRTWQIAADKITVVPNGTDVHAFGAQLDAQKTRTMLGLQQDESVVMFAGRFHSWHGIDHLVEAFAKVQQELPGTRLVLVGDGETRSSIEKKVAEYGLENRVIFTGAVDYKDMPMMLAGADVVVAPYPTEPPGGQWQSPMKLYDYLAAGKAIVASRSGQIAEIIRNGYNGVLAEPGNAEELAHGIIALLRDPIMRERLGQNARRQATEQHSWEQHVHKLEQVYRGLQ